ncbi:MAG: hypothetical protein WC943_08555, partial [Elusimicrobiota bacterium]
MKGGDLPGGESPACTGLYEESTTAPFSKPGTNAGAGFWELQRTGWTAEEDTVMAKDSEVPSCERPPMEESRPPAPESPAR